VGEIQKQLREWLKGNSIHNVESDECCPDFSCCGGDLAPLEARQRFAKAVEEGDDKTKLAMLGGFLSGMIAKHFNEKKVHITGDTTEPQVKH